jgi:hypothetical protein
MFLVGAQRRIREAAGCDLDQLPSNSCDRTHQDGDANCFASVIGFGRNLALSVVEPLSEPLIGALFVKETEKKRYVAKM